MAAAGCQRCWKRATWSSVHSVRTQHLHVPLGTARAWTLLCRLQRALMLQRHSKH